MKRLRDFRCTDIRHSQDGRMVSRVLYQNIIFKNNLLFYFSNIKLLKLIKCNCSNLKNQNTKGNIQNNSPIRETEVIILIRQRCRLSSCTVMSHSNPSILKRLFLSQFPGQRLILLLSQCGTQTSWEFCENLE